MDKYENISVVGEGSYGLVMKCRHRETGQLVAIKKFIETEEDQNVRKMALREIRMLKKLRHENLVNLIEVFRRKRRFYLVFEFVDHTVLDELEEKPGGLGELVTRCHTFQVLRAIHYCHSNNIVHRDVKPENVLVSRLGVVKLCDFGFARLLAAPGEPYTDYVATRWYRAPELLVGDVKYGREVDIWAVGCLFAEMMTGDPLFPGDSDIDQLFQIVKMLGKLAPRHQQLVARNPLLRGLRRAAEEPAQTLARTFPAWPSFAVELLALCLAAEPAHRPSAADLMEQPYFTHDHFPERFLPELLARVAQESQGNPLLRRQAAAAVSSASRRDIRGTNLRRSFADPPRWRVNLIPAEQTAGGDSRRFLVDLNKPASRRKMSDGNNIMDIAEEDCENKDEPAKTPGMLSKSDLSRVKVSVHDIQLSTNFGDEQTSSPSPAPFQSLQLHTFNANTQVQNEHSIPSSQGHNNMQVLHPSINNLSFSVNRDQATTLPTRIPEPLKKSPLVPGGKLREVNRPLPTTTSVNATPMLHVAPRTTFIRRLDRSLMLDVCTPDTHQPNESPPGDGWITTSKRLLSKPQKQQAVDEFSLPNLPGATGSPTKASKKKQNPTHQTPTDAFISPRGSCSRSPSQSPKTRFGSNLPFV
ncbi:uncharacterized protein LOC126323281 isoform X1 [Schistocerca gregaria]|uniref:uncharacterized protein LOC126323281 isoform X1 n=1 Tax=Schistocerca gregaria TaxID=7010 RepID=UPI00211EE542|nr:uncharacterized protein LOC126323281 isoform X1 [Schistocerca gregaria]XP_049850626.1 uncharacterized protein LOC126323281 isoform X1 [Schistocerca gregaria]XP_049850627.1 uncharacterized protein LOC126323281 isoform X1 [Schistocerca gregaria]XP_049850628.1 uncharacterized protein LOC126323281 isoform X1 [Schistocerca gregaria]